MKKKKTDGIAVKGFCRLQIVDKNTKKIVGDSGWVGPNQITNYGLNSCVVAAPFGAGSVQAAGLLLGSGSVPASNATTLPNSLSDYWSAFAYSSVIDSLTARMSVSFDGTLGAVTLSNIGALAVSSDTLLWGNTFASSALATTQDVNCTYELRYSTS
jgi:hypothetical protein